MSLGTTFIAIDSDAMGDGGNYTLLADTWFQRRVQHNIEDLLSRGNSVCFSPYSSSADDFTSLAGIRPYTALEWHTIWVGWVTVQPDQTGASFTFSYHSTVPGSGSDAGDVEVRIVMAGEEKIATLGKSFAIFEQTRHQTVEIDLGDSFQSSGLVEVVVSVRSVLDGGGVSTDLGASADGSAALTFGAAGGINFGENATPGANAVWAHNSAGTAPDNDSHETMFLQVSGSNGLIWANSAYQFLHDVTYSSIVGASQISSGVIQPLPEPTTPGASVTASAVQNQCFLLRAFTYKPVIGSSTAPHSPTATIAKRRLAPNIGFGAPVAMQQAALARRAYLQPRLQLFGPRGRKANASETSAGQASLNDNYDYYGYATHWPMVTGLYTDAAVGQYTEVINDQFWMDTLNPRLELRCLWVSSQYTATWNTGRVREVADGTGKNARKPFEKGAFENITGNGSARWDITVLVDQLVDVAAGAADWATDATQYYNDTEVKTIPVHGAMSGYNGHAPPVLRGIQAQNQGAKATANPPGFWYKEGSLFEEDLRSGVLYETQHTINVTGMDSAAPNLPFRLKVNADLNNFNNPIVGPPNTATTKGQLVLYLVGFVLVEIPQEP